MQRTQTLLRFPAAKDVVVNKHSVRVCKKLTFACSEKNRKAKEQVGQWRESKKVEHFQAFGSGRRRAHMGSMMLCGQEGECFSSWTTGASGVRQGEDTRDTRLVGCASRSVPTRAARRGAPPMVYAGQGSVASIKYTTIGLCLSGHGAAEVFINIYGRAQTCRNQSNV